MIYELNRIPASGLNINETISFDNEYLKLSEIKKLDNINVSGRLYYSVTDEVIFNGHIKGVMQLVDYNTKELIDYPFSCDIDEVIAENIPNLRTNNQNRLDLKEILWQNIVLEVPIRVTKTNGPSVIKGQGWELRDENSKKDDPRLECFKALLEEGKE